MPDSHSGYSTGQPTAKDENDVAQQFSGWLNNMYRVFPELNAKKLYITGESYAGL